ncbi:MULTISPECIES: rhodanese-like domain-containing protein [Kangiella]|jgi:rhodanese-related sulfurtransferase|uniref:Rhodanese-like domain-containing protein n=2 Tax=Kangiella TaxID=261963 RepID=A0A318D9T1_9GAMM|nr:rhodanese-like domain-containing protein [Kangiella spongicola]MBV34772.1 rhodanese [Rickettsiales bacterium]PXF64014.1 rhodanese-like domain-containing protein [Kangiella spongicola]
MQQLFEFFGNHPFLGSAWLAFALLLLISIIKTLTSGSKSLTPLLATQMINKENAQVVDLRSVADFNKGHIHGSVNIPFTKVKDSVKDLEKYKQVPIIMVCNTGIQSGSAAITLRKFGFNQVHKLKGGIQSWSGDNLPLVKG